MYTEYCICIYTYTQTNQHGNMLLDQYIPATSQVWHQPAHLQHRVWCVCSRSVFQVRCLIHSYVLSDSILSNPPIRDDISDLDDLQKSVAQLHSTPGFGIGIPRFPTWTGVVHLNSCSFRLGPSGMGAGKWFWSKFYAETENSGAKHQGWCHDEKHV